MLDRTATHTHRAHTSHRDPDTPSRESLALLSWRCDGRPAPTGGLESLLACCLFPQVWITNNHTFTRLAKTEVVGIPTAP